MFIEEIKIGNCEVRYSYNQADTFENMTKIEGVKGGVIISFTPEYYELKSDKSYLAEKLQLTGLLVKIDFTSQQMNVNNQKIAMPFLNYSESLKQFTLKENGAILENDEYIKIVVRPFGNTNNSNDSIFYKCLNKKEVNISNKYDEEQLFEYSFEALYDETKHLESVIINYDFTPEGILSIPFETSTDFIYDEGIEFASAKLKYYDGDPYFYIPYVFYEAPNIKINIIKYNVLTFEKTIIIPDSNILASGDSSLYKFDFLIQNEKLIFGKSQYRYFVFNKETEAFFSGHANEFCKGSVFGTKATFLSETEAYIYEYTGTVTNGTRVVKINIDLENKEIVVISTGVSGATSNLISYLRFLKIDKKNNNNVLRRSIQATIDLARLTNFENSTAIIGTTSDENIINVVHKKNDDEFYLFTTTKIIKSKYTAFLKEQTKAQIGATNDFNYIKIYENRFVNISADNKIEIFSITDDEDFDNVVFTKILEDGSTLTGLNFISCDFIENNNLVLVTEEKIIVLKNSSNYATKQEENIYLTSPFFYIGSYSENNLSALACKNIAFSKLDYERDFKNLNVYLESKYDDTTPTIKKALSTELTDLESLEYINIEGQNLDYVKIRITIDGGTTWKWFDGGIWKTSNSKTESNYLTELEGKLQLLNIDNNLFNFELVLLTNTNKNLTPIVNKLLLKYN
jgi:hypothetical protein